MVDINEELEEYKGDKNIDIKIRLLFRLSDTSSKYLTNHLDPSYQIPWIIKLEKLEFYLLLRVSQTNQYKSSYKFNFIENGPK